jgi:hypothetical protein
MIILTKVIQIEFGRRPFFLFQKDRRVVVTKTKTTKARITRKTVSKKQTKRKVAKIKDKAKEDLDLEKDDLLDELEESKFVYIREKTPATKKQKAKSIIEAIVPKRNICLAAKRV